MKIKSKLLLSLLLVSLIPVSVGCFFSYVNARTTITNSFVNHLKSVSSLQHARIHAMVAQNMERLALVASRTQLRISLATFLHSPSPRLQENMNRILADAISSMGDFEAISIYSPAGVVVASTDRWTIGARHSDDAFFVRCRKEFSVDTLFLDENGRLRLYLSGPLYLDGQPLGVIVIRSKVDNLIGLVSDYSGLGRSGETLIVRRDAQGNSVFLTPTRFDSKAALTRTLPRQKGCVVHSSCGGERIFTGGIDYRGRPVLAIARQIETTGWGMVVKIDKEEAYEPVVRLRHMLAFLILFCVAAVLLVALVVARNISRPIDHLASVARKVAAGDFSRKAQVSSGDEIGELAGAFNTMLDSLGRVSSDLEKKNGALQAEVASHERLEAEKELLIGELKKALVEIKTLRGIVPICSSCKKIRDDKGLWNQIEAYVRDHSEAEFSHGLCPDCAKTLYPHIAFPDELRKK